MTNPTDNNDQSVVSDDDLTAFERTFYGKDEPVVKDEVVDDADVDDEDAVEAPEEDDAGDENDLPATEDEDADEGEDEELDEEDDDPEPEPKPKKKQSLQERINQLVEKAREAEEREQAALARLAKLEQAAATKTEKEPEKKEEPKRPDFSALEGAPDPDAKDKDGELLYPLGEFDPLFIRDLTRFTIQKETEAHQKAAEEKLAQEKLQEEMTALQTSWNEKLTEAEKEVPDLREKIATLETTFSSIDPKLGEFLSLTIMSCSNGPEILYYLSQNLSEARSIVASGPTAATLAIGRLEARLERKAPDNKDQSNKKKVSKAAPPPNITSRGAGAKSGVRADTDDLDAFEREFFVKRK